MKLLIPTDEEKTVMIDAGVVVGSIYYPDSDGEPISESDATRDYLI
jgi:hypothetical protein